jgi:replicative superfamily II helicase
MTYATDSRKSILIKKALSQTALGQVRQGYFENIEDYKEFYRAFTYSPRTYNRHEQSVFYDDPREEIRFLLKESGMWSPEQLEFMRLAVYAKMLDKSPERFDPAVFQEALIESKQQMVDITLDAMIQLNQRADTYKETNKKTKLPLAVKPELFELPLDEFFKVAYRERPETKKYMLIREIHQHAGAEKKGPYKLPTLLSDLAEQAKP